jgi:hypothetical protein
MIAIMMVIGILDCLVQDLTIMGGILFMNG